MSSSPPASILILVERSDRWFASPEAYAELLYLEGINDVEGAYLDELTPALLENRSVVLLGPADPSLDQARLLLGHVKRGGGLICFAPGEAFAGRLGLRPRRQGMMDGRIRPRLRGFPDEGLPVKGWIQLYDATEEAAPSDVTPLMNRQGHLTGAPALLELGEGRGVILVLAYDPASSVYLLRQGNPMLAGCRSSGFDRMRPSDLFEAWQDERDAAVPVADLHCHFLRDLVQRAWPADTVLPWLWYFPDNADTMMVFTSDDDWSTREQFEALIDACETHSAGLTFYLVQERSVMDRAWLENLAVSGFDFSIHPDLPPPTLPLWDRRLADHIRQFRDTYGREPSPSVRNHCITWSGYIEGARIEAKHGFTFDTNTFSLLPQGKYYMNGAGLPMRFAALDGEALPVYQLPTQFSDETTLGGQGFPWSLDLTPEEGVDLITGIMQQNATRLHSMLCVNAHPVSFATYSAPLWTPVLAYAQASGIPVWDVDRFSRFWQARREVRLRPIPRGQASIDTDGMNLEEHRRAVMIPAPDGAPDDVTTRTVHGRRFIVRG